MIELRVVTPRRQVLDVFCDSVRLPGVDGEFEVLSGHAPLLAAIKIGVLEFKYAEAEKNRVTHEDRLKMMVAGGYAEVDGNRVNVLCDAAALPDEVDKKTETEFLEKLHLELRSVEPGNDAEFKILEAKIQTAHTKLAIV